MLMGVVNSDKPLANGGVTVAPSANEISVREVINDDGSFGGYELAEEISFQNGNCVNGQPCPGAPIPMARPENMGISCGADPNQDKCSDGEASVEKDTIDKEEEKKRSKKNDDETEEESEIASQEPKGPSLACQSSVEKINQCSQVPSVNVAVPRGNILGNYDAATETMRRGSATLSQYSSQCQSLMSQCVSSCSSANPFDQNLRGQCYRYQSQVNQASNESKNLNAMSLQTEQAAATIRSGASDFKKNSNIGRGYGLQVEAQVQNLNGEIKQVRDKPLLDKVKMQSYDQVVEAGEEDVVETERVAQKKKPILLASTIKPIQMNASDNQQKAFVRGRGKSKSSLVKQSKEMHKGYFNSHKKRSRKSLQQYRSQSSSKRTSLKKSKPKRSGLLSPEEIMKQRYEDRQRAVASENGLFRTDISIFHSICLRYDDYEKKSGINEGQSKCPPAY